MINYDPKIHNYDEYSKLAEQEINGFAISMVMFFLSAGATLVLTITWLYFGAIFMATTTFFSLVAAIVFAVRYFRIPTRLTKRKICLDWDPDCWEHLGS